MPNYLELIYNPNKFFSDVKKEDTGFLPSLAFVLASAILSTVAAATSADVYAKAAVQLAISQGLAAERAQMVYAITYYSTIISPFIVTFIMWLIFSAILHAISALFGGKGNFTTTLKFIGFCFLPSIVLFPISFKIAMDTAALISSEGFQGIVNESIKVAGASLGTISIFWQLVLWGFALMHARELDARRAFTTAVIPALIYLAMTWYSLIRFL